jgi:ABC-type nitrate/sulfonate/bicarbonate transport system permease component
MSFSAPGLHPMSIASTSQPHRHRSHRARRAASIGRRVLVVLLLVVAWQCASWFGWVNVQTLASPIEVWHAGAKLWHSGDWCPASSFRCAASASGC